MPDPAVTQTPREATAAPAPQPEALPGPVSLTADERETLLTVARASLAAATGAPGGSVIAEVLSRRPPVERCAAAFVTLTEGGELRGCIGHMDARAPITANVVEAATWAALEDPRFAPVRRSELPGIHVEVSVLGPLVRLADPLAFRLGVDGVVVEREGRRGLLLPEVAGMLGNDRTAMLDTACRKAGLRPGAWRQPGTATFAFRTDRFGGPALEGVDEP